MAKIKSIKAREILDSRGNPTLEARVELEGGAIGVASVPSGASIGKYEALELRDNDPHRYNGLGVLKAVNNINQIIAPKLIGIEAHNQLEVDRTLLALDGTPNKSKLGANATLAVSQGVCEAAAAAEKVNNFEHVAHLYGLKKEAFKIPTPLFNLINGGEHGAGNLDFQEFHLVPHEQKPYDEALKVGEEIYQGVKKVLIRNGAIHSVGDEGGFAPNLFTNLDALEVLTQGVKEAGYELNKDAFLSLDVAAGFFYKDGRYRIRDRSMPMETNELIEFYKELLQQYPLIALEDPLDEDDWDGWQRLTKTLTNLIIVGDDLLATNKKRLEEAIKKKACTAILVKPNQIGTIAETIEVIKIARQAGFKIVVSHRSGETEDDFIADFAVGVNADYVKFGAPARGERVAKYNRLLAIQESLKGERQ
ncbi:phosphopyruvate hydratase [Candidatus Woesebacteria bacterium CG_4_10_14_0_2_um_filter_39_14]|uniref:Enolase n=1 Tax=Candidatus Woesebacteria bacterium CG_4_10_14_0_2_um_filter_39_14 TaxID=1975054 RepID=A0A2M7TKT9_9BACT|nr:MAG: phosphopyruvate hydratase [Candidatus Woesebacteria bacterium CG_4_10_14_0_2_um_filter_39_14]